MNGFYPRYAKLILAVLCPLFPLALWGAVLASSEHHNDVQEWLPKAFEETAQYERFKASFANETYILASWEGCTLDDPRVGNLAAALSSESKTRQPGSEYFTKIVSGPSVVHRLTSPPVRLAEEEAIRRLKGALIGPDGQQTCAVLTLSPAGKADLHAAVATVYDTGEKLGIARDTMRLGGPPVDNVAIDEEGQRSRITLMVVSGVVGLALSWWYLRMMMLTLIIFIGSVFSAALSLALIRVTGGTVDAIMFTMPAVVYTAALCCAIHIVNYYRHTRLEDGLEGAADRALKISWIPCTLSAGTTGLGLISLYTSDLEPVKNFGLYAFLGVMAMVVLMYLYLPSALQVWPPNFPTGESGHVGHETRSEITHHRRMRWLGRIIIARPLLVWAVFAVIGVTAGAGLLRARTTIDLMGLFSKDAQIIQSYSWLEEKLGPMVPMEVVVRFSPDCQLSLVERMDVVERVQQAIGRAPDVGSTMSSVNFVPDLHPRRAWLRSTINKRLEEHRDELLDGDYLAIDNDSGEQLWRISLRAPALKDIDYGAFVERLQEQVEPVIAKEKEQGVKGIAGVTYTGMMRVVYRAEKALLQGLIESFFGAFAMMATVMSLVFRDIRAGLYTMLPNVWPVAVVFGLMSWLGIALDIGTMMTASVAMGVCVDDTVHFANWFRRGTREGLNRREASVFAFENSAGAIYQSTLIVALGLLTFALSSFMPTQRFGYLMCTLLCFGIVADLVLTPAMLSGVIGRYFTRGCVAPLPQSTVPETAAADATGSRGG